MKQILIDLDDRCARDLDRVAPPRLRKRAEFIRAAIRRAIDAELERQTSKTYRASPPVDDLAPGDLDGWDPANALARPAATPAPRAPSRRRAVGR